MKYYLKTKFKIEYLLFLSVCFLIIRCNDTPEVYKLGQTEKINPGSMSYMKNEEIAVTAPPFTDGIFPAMIVMNSNPNPVRRDCRMA